MASCIVRTLFILATSWPNQEQFTLIYIYAPVTIPARSKACTVFARSEAGIVGSNPIQGMDVGCLCLFCVCIVLYLGSRPCDELITRPSSPTVCKNDHETEKLARAHGGCRASEKIYIYMMFRERSTQYTEHNDKTVKPQTSIL
jgi:hypothetical protein